jgi:RNA polymerase sigma-70 factor (ECF subfamily)
LGNLFEKELEGMIQDAIENLPAKCREIFLLSRDEEMTYGQIAETLNISENTVKTQVKTALSRIRIALKDYLILGAIGIIKLFFG